jgi:hypothetical protein
LATYVKQTWSDAPATTTPISAARLGTMEQGILDAVNAANAADSHAGTAQGIAEGAASAASTALGNASSALSAVGAKARTYYQASAPSGSFNVGDMWFDSDDSYRLYIWNGSAWGDGYNALYSAVNGAVTAASTKNRNYYSSSMPAGSGYTVGDLWFDTTGSTYRMYIWSGSAWVDGQATLANASAAALTSANGKNKNYYQTTAPTGGIYIDGDLWFDTSTATTTTGGNKISKRSGGAWVATSFGAAAVTNLDAGSIVTGTLGAAVMSAITINASQINAGTLSADLIGSTTLTAKNYYSDINGVSRIVIGPNYRIAGLPTIYWDVNGDGVQSSADPLIYATVGGGLSVDGGTGMGKLTLTSGGAMLTGGNNSRFVRAGDTEVQISYDGTHSIFLYSSGTVVAGGFSASSATGSHVMTVSNTSVYLAYDATHSITLLNGRIEAVGGMNITSGGLSVTGTIDAPGVWGTSVGTTVGQAVRVLDSSGRLGVPSPSSIRYKENVVDIAMVPGLDPRRLLDIPVRSFTYKPGVISDTDYRAGVPLPGFIAEEVYMTYPIAADVFEDGTIHTWNERYLIPGMLALIQEQHQRLLKLEAA